MPNPQDNVPPTLPLPESQRSEESRADSSATVDVRPPAESNSSTVGHVPPPTERDEAPTSPGAVTGDRTAAFTPSGNEDVPTQPLAPGRGAARPRNDLPQTVMQTAADTPSAHMPSEAFVPGYEILGELGRGGMGVVYKARQVGLNRLVALKMILSGAHAGKQELDRFRAEAEAVARLQHPNIVQIYEVNSHEGRPFFSLEFLEGGSLADKLHGEPMTPQHAAQLVETLARAMHAAHQAGIVHRDLKPGNILLSRRPTPTEIGRGAHPLGIAKITDFGLAKDIKEGGSSGGTVSGSVLGTPNYMAPEQAAGKIHEIGPPADIYALGAILYELFTGRPPFKGDSPWDTIKQVTTEDPLPPRRLRRGLPADLETICLKCLRKEPPKRYGTANELADDLRRWLDNKPIQARPVGDWERLVKWARRQPAVAALLATLALVITGGLIGMMTLWIRAEVLRGRAEDEQAAAEKARNDAEKARNDALEKEALASRLKDQARQDYERARRAAYASQLNLAQNAIQEARFDRAAELLEDLGQRAGDEEDLRGFEWHYLWRVSHSRLTVKGHTSLVSGLTFSPDGKRMATASLDGTVKVWDPDTGDEVVTLEGHLGPVRAIAYSPDGKLLATGGEDGTARLWDPAAGKQLREFSGHTGFVTAVAFGPDGKRLATASEDHTARVWDIAGEKSSAVLTLRGHAYGLTTVAFSPDGKRLATGSWDRTARIWDLATGKEEQALRGHDHWVRFVCFSPDGRRLATSSWDRTVRLWDAFTWESIRTLKGFDTPVKSMAFSPDGQRLLTLSIDDAPRMWDLTTNEELPMRVGPGGPVRGIGFSPDGQLLAVVRFDFSGKGFDVDLVLPGHKSSVHGVAFTPAADRRELASCSADGTVILRDPETWETVRTLSGHDGPIRSMAYSPDGSLLATGGEDGSVRLWEPATGKERGILRGHEGWVTALAFSPDGRRLASGSKDHTLRVWDLAADALSTELAPLPLLNLGAHDDGVLSLAYSPDGKRIASGGGDGRVRLWDTATGIERHSLTGHQGQVRAVLFTAEGDRLITAGWDGLIVIRDGETGSPLQTLRGHTYGVTGLSLSPDGKRLASSSEDRTVKVWDLTSGRELLTLPGHEAGVTSVAFSGDGTLLASGCWDQKVRVWQAPRQE